MERRSLLASVGSLAAVALAGCTGGGSPGAGGPDETEPPAESTEPPTESDTPTESGSQIPTLVDTSFTRTGDASDQSERASVAFTDTSVECTGVIRGNDGCQRAALKTARYDEAANALRVRVTTESDGGDVCTQQIVYRGYESTFAFEGGLPGRVVVEHESMGDTRTLADVDR